MGHDGADGIPSPRYPTGSEYLQRTRIGGPTVWRKDLCKARSMEASGEGADQPQPQVPGFEIIIRLPFNFRTYLSTILQVNN